MAVTVQTPTYDAQIEDNIAQVSRKIRLTDLGRGVLALACLLLGYALVVGGLDLALGGGDGWLSLSLRLVAFATLIGAVGIVGIKVISRFLTQVNPYFAARKLEETMPDAKNSLINWLDLKDEPLPPVIHTAVGARAVQVLEDADPELVASSKDVWKLTIAACVLFIGLGILFFLVPRQFGSLMARAFVPLGNSTLEPRTVISILKPGVGDVVVPANQRIDFLAKIEGRVPLANSSGAPALYYRYATNDVAVRVPLDEDNLGQWGVRLSPDQVRTGFFWKITAGDASTPEVQLRVRSQPFVTRFDATYTYRPYRKLASETVSMPNEAMPQPRLVGHRGTDVVLKARTNVTPKSAAMELDVGGVKKIIPAEVPATDPQSLVFRFGLEKSGSFRILFETKEGEKNVDRTSYPVDVLEDSAPYVELLKPGKDLVTPANATVLLAGVALDDFGVTGMTLKSNLGKAGTQGKAIPRPLAPIPYKPKFKLQFDDGTYPVAVQYAEVLLLDELRSADGKLIMLTEGDEITYWLEATDNFDFGRPNVGKSKAFKITIKDGLQPAMEQKEERKTIQKTKEQHDNDQKKEHDTQNQEKNEGGGKSGDNSKKDGNKGGSDGNDKNSGDQGGDKKQNNTDNKNGDNKQNDGNSKNPDPKNQSGKNSGDQKSNDNGGNGNAGEGPKSPEEQQKKNLEDQLKNDLPKLDQLNGGKGGDGAQKPPEPKNSSDKKPGGDNPPNPKNGDEPNPKKDSGNPKDGNPKDGNPKDGNPKDGNPKDGNPKDGNPKDGDSKEPNPKDGTEKSPSPMPGGKDDPGNKQGNDKGPADKSSDPDAKKDAAKGSNNSGGKDGNDTSKSGPGGEKEKSKDADPSKDKAAGNDPGNTGSPTDKKGDVTGTEKGKTSDGAKSEKADKKSGNEATPGTAKGNEPSPKDDPKAEPKGTAKAGDGPEKKSPGGEAKSKDGKNGEPGSAKEFPADQKPKDASVTKDDGKGDKGPPTKNEIEALKDLLKKNAPEADAAAKDLSERGKELKDPGLKKELEDILREAGRDQDLNKLAGKDFEQAPPPQKVGDGPKGTAGKDGDNQKAGNDPSPKTGPGGKGLFDELKKLNPEQEFNRRLGNLQLENLDDLKKRVSPDDLKKADISPDEWNRFLDNARKYQELTKRMQNRDDNRFLRGRAGKMANTGLRTIQTNPNAMNNPETGAAAAPPWEFRDQYQRFTRKAKE